MRYLLCSGVEETLYLAKELLTTTKHRTKNDNQSVAGSKSKKVMPRLTNSSFVLSYDDSVNLVLEAAKEYFDAGANLVDPSMALSRYVCIMSFSHVCCIFR